MMTMKMSAVPIALLALALTACDRAGSSASAPASPSPTASPAAASTPGPGHAWLGRWNGPEGTYLQLDAKGDTSYEVRIKDLDAERTFQAVGKAGGVQFERDGKQESITATNGDATGMKWLAGKTTCLTVHSGEGYCRD